MEIENIITTTYEAVEGSLKKTDTPDKIIPSTKTYNIKETQEKIAKINNAISTWEDKRAPLQEILDKYNEIKPVEVVEKPIIE